MRTALVSLVAVGLTATVALAANPKDPQQRHTPADTRTAAAMGLRLSDFVSGWKQRKGDTSSDACAAQPDESNLVETADVAREFDYGSGGAISVQSEVQLFATVAQAKADWATYRLATLRPCMNETFAKGFGRGWKIHSAIDEVSASGLRAERALHFRLRVVGAYQTRKVDFTSDLILLGKGRVTVTISTFAPKGVLDPSSLSLLVARVERRLAHA